MNPTKLKIMLRTFRTHIWTGAVATFLATSSLHAVETIVYAQGFSNDTGNALTAADYG